MYKVIYRGDKAFISDGAHEIFAGNSDALRRALTGREPRNAQLCLMQLFEQAVAEEDDPDMDWA